MQGTRGRRERDLFNRYLPRAYCVPATVAGTGDTAVDKRGRDPCPHGQNIPVGEMDSRQDKQVRYTVREMLINRRKIKQEKTTGNLCGKGYDILHRVIDQCSEFFRKAEFIQFKRLSSSIPKLCPSYFLGI